MPLQIRRGTELQRLAMTVPLASGELLYVTDDQRLYIGNGTVLGGVPITGYNDENAVDAVGAALVNGVHSNISFTYGTTQDASNRIDAIIDLSNYSGTLKADAIKGTIVADDSTVLVDAVSGRIVGPVFSNVTGNVTGNLTGNVTGNITGVITGTAGSTLIGDVTGNLTGYHFGDTSGSVFADDSSVIVNGISKEVFATSINSDLINVGGSSISYLNNLEGRQAITLGTSSNTSKVVIYGTGVEGNLHLIDFQNQNSLLFKTFKGSINIPGIPDQDVSLLSLNAYAYTGHSIGGLIANWAQAGAIRIETDDTATINPNDGYVKGTLTLVVFENASGTDISAAGLEKKSFTTNVAIIPGKFTTATRNSNYPTPAEGMVIFNSTLQKFQGYVSDTGLAAGGPSNATPGWIDLN